MLLPSAHPERVFVHPAFEFRDAHALQALHGLGTRGLVAQRGVRLVGFDDLVAIALYRVQANAGFLKDHAHLPPAHGAHGALRSTQQIQQACVGRATKQDVAGSHKAVVWQ